MKEELSLEKLNGVKLWITAGPREKFTAAEVCCWSVVGGQMTCHLDGVLGRVIRIFKE